VKALRIRDGLVEGLSRCLRLDDGEDPLKLLPELQELNYPWRDNTSDAIAPFIDARQSISLSAMTRPRRSRLPHRTRSVPNNKHVYVGALTR